MDEFRKQFDLSGKTAIVTGAAGILGKNFCRGLAEFGASIALVDIEKGALDDLQASLSHDFSQKFVAYKTDITNPQAVHDLVQKVENDFGKIDILHNNAASKSDNLQDFFASFEDYSLEAWRKIMAVNVDGMFLMAQSVGRHMLAHNIAGSIVQTGSIYGIVAPDQRIYEGSEYLGRTISSPAVYSVSKAAVVGLTRYLAAYWGSRGIRVNCLVPGGNESGQNEQFKQNYSRRIPLGRMGQPNEMVGTLLYLASDASRYVTGQCLMVDGGLTAW